MSSATIWLIFFFLWAVTLPMQAGVAQAISHKQAMGRHVNINMHRLYLTHQIVGIIIGFLAPIMTEIGWYWAIIFPIIAFYSATLTMMLTIAGSLAIWLGLLFLSGVI